MPVLSNYHHFEGRHWETGPLHNLLAFQGIPAPHTGKPISEAMLLGISGGIAFGYFTFAYGGYDPHVALLTRNTFDPLDTIYDRLALPREILQTSKPETGLKNLTDVLESGHPALVWLDAFSLPYRMLPYDPRNWMQVPVVVYGVEGEHVYIADRSKKPYVISPDSLNNARARIKDVKFRVITFDAPDMSKLATAVQKGIWQCISLFTESPPKGSRKNFGFDGMMHLADMLTNLRNKDSWERYFPPGRRMYMALAGNMTQPGMFDWIRLWGGADGAERGLYADFLDEAALLLEKPGLSEAAAQFRLSGDLWTAFANALLPDEQPVLKEVRELKLRRHSLLIEEGDAAADELQHIRTRLSEIWATMDEAFPLSASEAAVMREGLREHLLAIRTQEKTAVEVLQGAI